MKLMPALPESVFDLGYLAFALVSGVTLLCRANGRKAVTLMGWMTLLLGGGDAFHLVPRVLNYWIEGDFSLMLGIGKLVTSITMTVFYLLFEYVRRERYAICGEKPTLIAVWMLVIARIALCCFPNNGWVSTEPSFFWAILRNIPFAILGALTVVLWLKSAKKDPHLKWEWLAVTLSFFFYLLVVVLSPTIPAFGALMLPKTVMYIWMIVMFRKVSRETESKM